MRERLRLIGGELGLTVTFLIGPGAKTTIEARAPLASCAAQGRPLPTRPASRN